MSSSLSRPLPSREAAGLNLFVNGAAVVLGLITAVVITGQGSAVSLAINNGVVEIGRWLGATPAADSRVYWYMARSAGVVAYLLLWGSAAWGIMVSSKFLDGFVKPPVVYELHKTLSILALVVGLFHGFVLLGDSYIQFSLLDILIPFKSSYQPFWVGLGTLGLYLTAILVGSFYIKKRIGHRAWRLLHYSSFALWVMITLHSVMTGTDSSSLLMQAVYTAAVVSVGYLLMYRVMTSKPLTRNRAQAH
jgi:predicted ferric reductase